MLAQVTEVRILMKAELGRLGIVVPSRGVWRSRYLRLYVSRATRVECLRAYLEVRPSVAASQSPIPRAK
jgi:hypothetical protein